jgi:thiol-disulfide isomerase/thioredoxin
VHQFFSTLPQMKIMKKISSIISVFLICVCPHVIGQNVQFESSLEAVFKKAQTQNKLVFVEYYNSTCTICISIEPLFNHPKISSFYNEHFVSYKMNTRDGLKDDETAFLDKQGLHFQGVPYFLFFDAQQDFLHFSGAKADVDYLLQIAKTALNPNERSASLIEKYNNGDRSIKTLYGYINLLQNFKESPLLNTVSAELFEVYPKQNLHTHQSFLILKNAVFSIDNGFFKYWYENKEQLVGMDKGSLKNQEVKILENILLNELKGDHKNQWSLSKIKEVKNMISNLNISDDPDEFLWEAEVYALHKNQKIGDIKKILEQQTLKNKSNIYGTLYILDFFMAMTTEKSILDTINHLVQQELKSSHSSEVTADFMILEVQYYKKMGQNEQYQTSLKKTREFFLKNQLDVTNLDSL